MNHRRAHTHTDRKVAGNCSLPENLTLQQRGSAQEMCQITKEVI